MIFNDLVVKVEEGVIVRARELYKELGISKNFGTWASKVIEKDKENFISWEIVESKNVEIQTIVSEHPKVLTGKYIAIKFKTKLGQFKNTNFKNKEFDDYIISLEMAKHIAMMSKTKKGEQVRDYFIQCEKELEEIRINAVKEVAMRYEHKDKMNITLKELYPILDRLGVLPKSRKKVHELLIKATIGKWENITLAKTFDESKFKEDYRIIAEQLKEEGSSYFEDKNQITIFDILEED